MGYPLKDMPIADLFEKLFKLHLNQLKFNKAAEHQFYYKDVLNVLKDPFLNKFQGELLQKICAKINNENTIFLSVETLKNYMLTNEVEKLSLVFSLFNFSQDMNDVIKQCSELIDQIKHDVVGVEKEYVFRFYRVFQQLETLNKKYRHIADLKTLRLFFNQLIRNEKLAFQGEPLQGLQLMGMLDTIVFMAPINSTESLQNVACSDASLDILPSEPSTNIPPSASVTSTFRCCNAAINRSLFVSTSI